MVLLVVFVQRCVEIMANKFKAKALRNLEVQNHQAFLLRDTMSIELAMACVLLIEIMSLEHFYIVYNMTFNRPYHHPR